MAYPSVISHPFDGLRFVTAESATEIFGTAPAINAERFRRDLDELAGQEITPRG